MPGPNIASSSPQTGATGVVLGQAISIVFDSLIDQSTLSSATISVSYPAGVGLITPESYIAQSPQTQTGMAYVQGTYTPVDANNATTLNFTPSQPLNPNTVYTVFVLGADQVLSSGRKQKPHARAPLTWMGEDRVPGTVR